MTPKRIPVCFRMWANLATALAILMLVACAGRPASIEHYLTYTAKGTRSEARHGHLVVDGQELPWAFSTVTCGAQTFSLHLRTHLWGTDGYFPEATSRVIPADEHPVSEASLARRYYLGDRRKAATPENWIFVTWPDGGAAFVAPDAIDALIRDRDIPVQPIGAPQRRRIRANG